MLFGRRSEPLTFVSPLVATLAVALAALACSKGEAGPTTRARPAPQVVVAKVVARDVPVEVHAPVDLRALEQVDVGSKVLGYIDAVLVDRGTGCAGVKSSHWCGQRSARSAGAARSVFGQTKASAVLARTNYDRANKLAPPAWSASRNCNPPPRQWPRPSRPRRHPRPRFPAWPSAWVRRASPLR